jgi:predicted Zn-dependent peptidase
VTAEQTQAAAQKYIQLDQTTVLAVGDRTKIEEDMKKLDLGKTEIRDAEGKLLQ